MDLNNLRKDTKELRDDELIVAYRHGFGSGMSVAFIIVTLIQIAFAVWGR